MAAPLKAFSNIIRHLNGRPLFSVYRYSMAASFEFDEKILEFIVCPVSKKPLRYDKVANELISDEINAAYPIVNGIPNLVPSDARMLKDNKKTETDSETEQQ